MKQLILHIPHSSTLIPFLDGYIVEKEILEQEILKLTDWYTDDLFFSENDISIRADFSRIFCDPERFSDDSREIMSKYGMGVLYAKTDDGQDLRHVTPALREKILTDFYRPHHSKLSSAVNEQLKLTGKATIVDCHSFQETPFNCSINKEPNRPDFNLGTDSFHTPQYLIDISVDFFRSAGYSLGIDWPYSGTIVPVEHYQKNNNVRSVMLEVNRKLYITEPSNAKTSGYVKIKKLVKEYIDVIRRL